MRKRIILFPKKIQYNHHLYKVYNILFFPGDRHYGYCRFTRRLPKFRIVKLKKIIDASFINHFMP